MRGKLSHTPCVLPHDRITPAGAGKTSCNSSIITGKLGSPPQVRGKLRGHLATVKQNGITPAGAGKTPSIRHLAGGGRDHPRRCGENGNIAYARKIISGSPPQVRGKP